MVSKKTAVKPSFFARLTSLEKEPSTGTGPSETERAYYAMSLTKGWQLFNSEVERLLAELDELNDHAVVQGTPYEELGRNTVVISLTRGVIRRLVNKIADAKESCERESGEK